MIVKCNPVARRDLLARHLQRGDVNEGVAITGARGLAGGSIGGALDQLYGLHRIRRGRAKEWMLHAHLSPPTSVPFSSPGWASAWAIFEDEYELEKAPYVEVEHRKRDQNRRRRVHRHRVYLRTLEDGHAISTSWNYARNEKIARLIEICTDMRLTRGRHNRAVAKALVRDGRHAAAALVEAKICHGPLPKPAGSRLLDQQVRERTGIDPEIVRTRIREAWAEAEAQAGPGAALGQLLIRALTRRELMLACGDRRDFVVVGPHGVPTSIPRALRAKSAAVRKRLSDLDLAALPTVADAKQFVSELKTRIRRGARTIDATAYLIGRSADPAATEPSVLPKVGEEPVQTPKNLRVTPPYTVTGAAAKPAAEAPESPKPQENIDSDFAP